MVSIKPLKPQNINDNNNIKGDKNSGRKHLKMQKVCAALHSKIFSGILPSLLVNTSGSPLASTQDIQSPLQLI